MLNPIGNLRFTIFFNLGFIIILLLHQPNYRLIID
jgi:hypothetical protein